MMANKNYVYTSIYFIISFDLKMETLADEEIRNEKFGISLIGMIYLNILLEDFLKISLGEGCTINI